MNPKFCPVPVSPLYIYSLERRRLNYDLILTYKILFGVVDLQANDFFQYASYSSTRGHRFKLYKNNTFVRVRSSFFSERVLNAWNKLPESIDFSSLTSFARSVKYIDPKFSQNNEQPAGGSQ